MEYDRLFIDDLAESLHGLLPRLDVVRSPDDVFTTQSMGEEGDQPSDDVVTTDAVGEEGDQPGDDDPTTMAVGEEGDQPEDVDDDFAALATYPAWGSGLPVVTTGESSERPEGEPDGDSTAGGSSIDHSGIVADDWVSADDEAGDEFAAEDDSTVDSYVDSHDDSTVDGYVDSLDDETAL